MTDKPSIEWLEEHVNTVEILPNGDIKVKEKCEGTDPLALLEKRPPPPYPY